MAKNKTTPSLFENFKTSNATVTELRVGIFAPITQVTASSQLNKKFIENGRVHKVKTKWGSVKVKGNILTQIHRDIIDAIFSTASFSETTKKGNVALFFSAYEVQKFLNRKSKTNRTWLKKKLDEIKTTNIEFIDKDGNTFDFNITDSGGYSAKKDSYAIIFTEGYMNFFQNEVSVNYKNEMAKLMKVENAMIRAIIRFFFTHANNIQIDLVNLLKVLGYPIELAASMKKARKAIRDYEEVLKSFNITVIHSSYLLKYQKLDTVTHNIPKNKVASKISKSQK